MAEEPGGVEDTAQDDTISSAAAAIQGLFTKKPELASGAGEPDPEPAPEPEPSRLTDPVDEPTPGEDAPAPAPTAPETPPAPDAKAATPPEFEQRLQEANKAKQEAETARNQYLNSLNTIVPQLQAQVQGAFSDIKTEIDVLNLMQSDPARYNEFVVQQGKLNYALKLQTDLRQQQEAEASKRFEEFQQTELKRLPEYIPELADPEKGKAHAAKLSKFIADRGYSADETKAWGARDFATLNLAMKAADLEAANKNAVTELAKAKEAAADKAKGAPPVQKPGTANPVDNKRNAVRDSFTRLQKSGRVEDAADVFRRILN